MSEGEVVAQLVEFTNVLLVGVSVFFTVVSAYIAALNYFIGSASRIARGLAFLFLTAVLAMLLAVMAGGQVTHAGLIARLAEIEANQGLSAAGEALLANSRTILFESLSLDDTVRLSIWTLVGVVYLALFYLTFFHRWKPETIPVVLQSGSLS